MKLTRIRIEQFRQFRQLLEISALDAGINLFTGPNEAGKSTIVAAIRAAFFERHRSGSVEDLRPWGDSTASPTVELEFFVGDQFYLLRKSFLGRKRCELRISTQRLDGADAEEHLAELLGFQYAGRGASAAEHWGIPGLLWIQQGSAQDLREAVAHATDHLRGALNESLGEFASSSGDEILATVETARNELLTTATAAPRGQYAEAGKQEADLRKKISELDAEIDSYRQKVDTLASLRRDHAAAESGKPWALFRAQEQEALRKLETIQRLQTSLGDDQLRASQLDAQAQLLRNQLESFAQQENEVSTRLASREAAGHTLSVTSELVKQWQAQAHAAAARYEAARAALRLARQEDTRRNLTDQLAELKLRTESTAATLAKADAEQMTLRELQEQVTTTEIGAADLATLRDQQRRIRELQIQQATAATRLHFALRADSSLQMGKEMLSGTGDRLLIEATILTLPGLGQIEISPGGSDLAELGRKEGALADRQAALLQRLGLASLDAAEARQQARAQRIAEIRTATVTLQALAPKGIEALRAEHGEHLARVSEVGQTLGRMPPSGQAAGLPAAAEAAEDAARSSLEQINSSLNQAQLAAGSAQASCEAATRELAAAQALLAAPDRAERLAAANQALVDTRAELAIVTQRIRTLSDQVAEARPDILRQDSERFRNSAEQQEKLFAERRDLLIRIEVEIQTAGAQGLDERHAELARDLAQVQRRVNELRRRANALDHLVRLLREKRSALIRRLQAPLQKHLNHYLQLLFPQASLEIDDNLSPGALTRSGTRDSEAGTFEALSYGARGQMGVISRLAYADLLRAAGRPTLIILDDALVHSDEERLARMKRVLFDAATRHQILLFTCHPENWRDLGVSPRSLGTIRAGM